MDHMNNSFRIKQINGKDTTDNYKQSPSNKFNPFSVEALKKVTPTNLKKNFDKINTSPIKVKSFKEDIGEDFFNERTADKTVNKNYTFTLPSGKENALNNSNFDIFPPNSNKFSSNKNFKLEPRNLCSPLRKADKSPSLNLLDSRNHLLVYSKQKKHSENKENEGCSSISSISNESSVITHSALSTLRKINEEFKEDTTGEFADDDLEENEKAYLKLLLEQKKSLKVPEEKANDERFKVFKMKEMRRPSMPPNKSVRYYDQIVPDWKKDMQNALDYSIVKKKKISHSARKNFATILRLYDNSNDVHHFALFRDKEIGYNEYWQAPLKISNADEDVDTDEEQLKIADHYVHSELTEAIQLIIKEGNNVTRNANLLSPGKELYVIKGTKEEKSFLN